MKILITGGLGFSAHYLAKLILAGPPSELYLTDRFGNEKENILGCDLTQRACVDALIERIKPRRIYHLAGSFTNDYETDYAVNVLGTKNLLDALLKFNLSSRVLLIGSSAEYGLINAGENPVGESQPLRPLRIQGLTKTYQTYLMNFYCRTYGMDLVMARTFNLSGEAKLISKSLFIGNVGEQIEKIKQGQISKIEVGNLEAQRDYLDVREAVKYYQKIMEQGEASEVYNVASGIPVKMRDLLASLLKEAGLDMSVVKEKPPSFTDKTDIPAIWANLRKIKEL